MMNDGKAKLEGQSSSFGDTAKIAGRGELRTRRMFKTDNSNDWMRGLEAYRD